MHIVYAIAFFVFIGLAETLRHGIFGLTGAEIAGIISGTLALFAVLFLRTDLIALLRASPRGLYGNPRLGWSWGASALALPLGALLLALPVVYALATGVGIAPRVLSAETALELAVLQILMTTLPEELFFRETVLKAFHQSLPAIYLISVLGWFIYHMPMGLPAALVAAGTGALLLTLRVIGAGILVIAVIHGAVDVALPLIVRPDALWSDPWVYCGYYVALSAGISAILLQVFSGPSKRGTFSYA